MVKNYINRLWPWEEFVKHTQKPRQMKTILSLTPAKAKII
jgi:hypothetical protein